MKKSLFVLCVGLLLFLGNGCGEKNIAEVNGEAITYEQFEGYWENLSKIYEANNETLAEDMKETVVHQLVYDTLLAQTAEELDCLPSKEEEETYYQEQMAENYGSYDEGMSVIKNYDLEESFFQHQYRCRLYEEKIMVHLVEEEDVSISEKEAQELYDGDPALYDWRKVSRLRILPYASDDRDVKTDGAGGVVYTDEEWNEAKARCEKLIAQLDKGEDFHELAMKYSDDANTAGSGGHIIETLYQDSEGYDEVFLTAAFSLMEAGDYTEEPVRTEEGYEILYCDSLLTPQRMDEVIPYIQETKKEQQERSLLTSYLEEREKQSDIVYHREVWE